jgi:hypothetical protein
MYFQTNLKHITKEIFVILTLEKKDNHFARNINKLN